MNKMINQLNKLLLYTFTIFIVASVIFYLSEIKAFQIKYINISGNDFLDNTLIQEQINTINKTILNINLKNLKKELMMNNYIEDVKIYTQLPNHLNIKIKEISPIAVIERNQNIYFLDKQLNQIPVNFEALNHFTNIPIITNQSDKNLNIMLSGEVVSKISNKAKNIYNELNELRYYNNKIKLYVGENTEIIINNQNLDNNLNKLFSFNNQFIQKNNISINSRYKKINLTIKNQIITLEKI